MTETGMPPLCVVRIHVIDDGVMKKLPSCENHLRNSTCKMLPFRYQRQIVIYPGRRGENNAADTFQASY